MTNVLDVVGLVLLMLFIGFVWLPLVLAVAGAGCLWVSWNLQRRTSRRKETGR